MRCWSWWFETRRVVDDDGSGNLTVDGSNVVHKYYHQHIPGWGFYLDNKFTELDTAGEWFFDSAAMKVYLWPPDGDDPDDHLVEGSCRDKGIHATGGSVSDICFRYQNYRGLFVGGTSEVTRCTFEYVGYHAFAIGYNVGGSRLSHCLFRNNLNQGIWWNQDPNADSSIIEFDTLLNTAMIPGYAGSDEWQSQAIQVSNGTGIIIRNNFIDSTGAAGISLGHDGNIVEYNIVKNSLQTLNDGAGIYANCGYTTIRHNIVLYTLGNLESSGPWFCLGQGIWLEFLGDFGHSRVEHNTSAFNGRTGLYLLNEFQDTIVNNVFFGNDSSQMTLGGLLTNEETGRTDNPPQVHTIRNNVFCATAPTQSTLTTQVNHDFGYGDIDSNYFLNPYRTDCIGLGGDWAWRNSTTTLANWQSTYTWADQNGKTDAVSASGTDSTGVPVLCMNPTMNDSVVSVGTGLFTDVDGNAVTDTIRLAPFTSRVLIRTGLQAKTSPIVGTAENTISVTPQPRSLMVSIPAGFAGILTLSVFDLRGRFVVARSRRYGKAGTNPRFWLIQLPGPTHSIPGSGVYLWQFLIRNSGTTAMHTARHVYPGSSITARY